MKVQSCILFWWLDYITEWRKRVNLFWVPFVWAGALPAYGWYKAKYTHKYNSCRTCKVLRPCWFWMPFRSIRWYKRWSFLHKLHWLTCRWWTRSLWCIRNFPWSFSALQLYIWKFRRAQCLFWTQCLLFLGWSSLCWFATLNQLMIGFGEFILLRNWGCEYSWNNLAGSLMLKPLTSARLSFKNVNGSFLRGQCLWLCFRTKRENHRWLSFWTEFIWSRHRNFSIRPVSHNLSGI